MTGLQALHAHVRVRAGAQAGAFCAHALEETAKTAKGDESVSCLSPFRRLLFAVCYLDFRAEKSDECVTAKGKAPREAKRKPFPERRSPMKNQTFGIELEMNGILRTKAASVIAAHFGTTPSQPDHSCYHTQTIRMPDGRVWKVMRDSSIPGPDDEKTEVVSPICKWEDIETVQELVRALRKAGAKADPAHCGIHVHIGLGSHTPKTLRNLVNIVNAKEDLLTQSLAIDPERRMQWCRPVDQDFLARLNRQKPQTMEAFARLWYNDRSWEWHAHQHYDQSRYRLLNLHAVWQKGTIEFRAFNSTLHAGEVKSYIQLCLAISHKALTAKAASPARPVTDNPKYTFRCWLLQLGFIGDEFETARLHLTKHLPGNSAWRQAS